MRLQVCRMEYEDAVGIGPEEAVSYQEAARILDMKRWGVSQLVDDGELAMLIDADATSDQLDWPNLGDRASFFRAACRDLPLRSSGS
jgi:hypothetical protein